MKLSPIEMYDKAIVKAGNAILGSYNWVTGGTKRDLIRKTAIGIPILNTFAEAQYSIFSGDDIKKTIFLAALALFASATNSAVRIGMYKNIIEGEEGVRGKPFKDSGAEYTKNLLSRLGNPVDATLSAAQAPFIFPIFAPYILENIILCADDLPPRKNCFSRGADWISEKVSEVREKYARSPQPAYVPAGREV